MRTTQPRHWRRGPGPAAFRGMIRTSLLGLMLLAIAFPSTAAAYEWRIAKPGKYPGGLRCAKTTGSIACFQARGDKVWVKDTLGDGVSAIAKWRSSFGYRTGYCRNRRGAGRWGVCNHNFREDFTFEWWAARYDRETNGFIGPWSKGRVKRPPRRARAAADGPRTFTKRHAGSARFQDRGDHVYLCDHLPDRRSVAVHLRYRGENGRYYNHWRWQWWGPKRFNGCKDLDLAVAEGTTIFYEPCLGVHGRPGPPRADVLGSTCGGWATADN
jgi:hypothetical protein